MALEISSLASMQQEETSDKATYRDCCGTISFNVEYG